MLFQRFYNHRRIGCKVAYSGTFIITVSGDPRKDSSIISISSQIQSRALRIDKNVSMSERNFMRKTYTLEWTGIPKDMRALSSLWYTLQRIIGLYLENWSYDIKVKMVETEGG